jgi:uncharacterized protein (DUF1778 family)
MVAACYTERCAHSQDLIKKAEHVRLSERDSLRVLNLLQRPPEPNAKLRAAARALPKKKP